LLAAARAAGSVSPPKLLESNFEFGPEYRLHSTWEYQRFFQGSDVLRLKECAIFRISNHFGHFRLGVTIKTKCSSVERNRVKRALRESFRSLKSRLGSYDYNVVISGGRRIDFEYARRLRKAVLEEFTNEHEMARFKRAR
jgi:ribonuclease P protein component